MRIKSAEPTPNPDAIKLVLEPPQDHAIRSYREGAELGGDPLAGALMGIPGVVGVLIHQRFITLSRTPGKSWGAITKAAEQAVAEHASGDGDGGA